MADTPGRHHAGLVGAFGSVLLSAVGFLLVKRWSPPTDMLTALSWQLALGGLFLVPAAVALEGPPSALDLAAIGGFAWIGVVGTGAAQWCWFRGLRRIPAGSVATIGLVNPAVGTLLGVAFAHEAFGPTQAVGMLPVLGGVLTGQGVLGRRTQLPAGTLPAALDAPASSNGPPEQDRTCTHSPG